LDLLLLFCCRSAVAAGDRLALVEFAAAEQTITALSLNGMKLGDAHAIQVGKQDWLMQQLIIR
jgi:hypothetical protein